MVEPANDPGLAPEPVFGPALGNEFPVFCPCGYNLWGQPVVDGSVFCPGCERRVMGKPERPVEQKPRPRRVPRPLCTCGYDLSGLPIVGGCAVCPECSLRSLMPPPRTPEPWPARAALIAALLVLLTPGIVSATMITFGMVGRASSFEGLFLPPILAGSAAGIVPLLATAWLLRIVERHDSRFLLSTMNLLFLVGSFIVLSIGTVMLEFVMVMRAAWSIMDNL